MKLRDARLQKKKKNVEHSRSWSQEKAESMALQLQVYLQVLCDLSPAWKQSSKGTFFCCSLQEIGY